jgi:hypothetical protein
MAVTRLLVHLLAVVEVEALAVAVDTEIALDPAVQGLLFLLQDLR